MLQYMFWTGIQTKTVDSLHVALIHDGKTVKAVSNCISQLRVLLFLDYDDCFQLAYTQAEEGRGERGVWKNLRSGMLITEGWYDLVSKTSHYNYEKRLSGEDCKKINIRKLGLVRFPNH